MASQFDGLWKAASPVFDAIFGDGFVLIPMTMAMGRPFSDGARPETAFTAILSERPKEIDLEGKRIASNTASPISSAITTIDFESDALSFDVKTGDRIRKADTGALYEVTGVRPDGIARVTLTVIQLASR